MKETLVDYAEVAGTLDEPAGVKVGVGYDHSFAVAQHPSGQPMTDDH